MSVSDGEKGNAANFNSSFLSRETDSDTIAIIGLNNTDPDSGDQIVNSQQAINNASRVVYSNQVIAGSGTVNLDLVVGEQVRQVSGSGGPQTASAVPFGANEPIDGTIITLIGTSDADPVTFQDNNSSKGMRLFGDATLKEGYMLQVIYMATPDRYYQINRSF